MPKKFAWSWSKLKNYRTCPKRHYEIDLAKNYSEAESEPLLWGNQVHSAMASRIAAGQALPATMQRYEWWPSQVATLGKEGVVVKVENKLAMDQSFQPCGFFDSAAWFRGVVDVLLLLPAETRSAVSIDWKTGNKVQPEFEQLALSAQLIFAHHPDVDHVLAIYVWFGHDTQTTHVYSRDDMVETWNKLWPEINVMAEAHRTSTYPPKPSGLCKNYCPVSSCIYHGKGSR